MNKRPIYDALMRALAQLERGQVDEGSGQVVSEIRALIESESLRSLLGFEPDTEVAIIWSVEDVVSVCPNLTPEQAIQVLRLVKKHHNACDGVNWDVIKSWAAFFLERESTLTYIA